MYQNLSERLPKQHYMEARIRGNSYAPYLSGTAKFFPWLNGTMVEIEIVNLPASTQPFAVHIHTGSSCRKEDFSDAGMHFSHASQAGHTSADFDESSEVGESHPAHKGDLPSVFSNNGYAYFATFTDRFTPREIENRTVVIGNNPDDFITQPSGNSGNRIACGVIRRM